MWEVGTTMLENVRLHPHENCACTHDSSAEQAEAVLEVKNLTKKFPIEGGKVLTACDLSLIHI